MVHQLSTVNAPTINGERPNRELTNGEPYSLIFTRDATAAKGNLPADRCFKRQPFRAGAGTGSATFATGRVCRSRSSAPSMDIGYSRGFYRVLSNRNGADQ